VLKPFLVDFPQDQARGLGIRPTPANQWIAVKFCRLAGL